MKFPAKNLKASTSIPAMINPQYRKEFLDDMPNKAGTRVRGVDLALINEAIRAILDGTAKINGKLPASRTERYIVIAAYFKTARTKFNMPFDGTADIKHNFTVSIRYNDQVYSYTYPENVLHN